MNPIGHGQEEISQNLIALQGLDLAKQHSQAAGGDSNNLIRFLTDSTPGLLSYWTQELLCIFANKNYLQWFGRTAQEMQGITLRELAGSDELYQKREPFIRAALRGEPQSFEATRTTANGELMHLWIQHIPHITEGVVRGALALVTDITGVKRDQQEVTHYIGIHHDITARKQLEEQVHELAFHDLLTKLPNRRLLGERLSQIVAENQ
jgi:PAS domain S-box-containing protein